MHLNECRNCGDQIPKGRTFCGPNCEADMELAVLEGMAEDPHADGCYDEHGYFFDYGPVDSDPYD